MPKRQLAAQQDVVPMQDTINFRRIASEVYRRGYKHLPEGDRILEIVKAMGDTHLQQWVDERTGTPGDLETFRQTIIDYYWSDVHE